MNDKLERAGVAIEAMNLLRIQTPLTDPDKFKKLCRRCNRHIHDEDFQAHDKSCPWTCGTCGNTFTSQQEHALHSMRCDGDTLNTPTTAPPVVPLPAHRGGSYGRNFDFNIN